MFVHNVSASLQMFHFLRPPVSSTLPKIGAMVDVMALPTVSLLCTEGSLVSVSSSVVLCAMQWRESPVSQGPFPVYVPDTASTFRSSCRLVNRDTIFCFLQSPISQFSVQLRTIHCKIADSPPDVRVGDDVGSVVKRGS